MSTITSKNIRVLITDVTSYLGAHICRELLARGFKVRGTVKHFSSNEAYTELIDSIGSFTDQFEAVEVNLCSDVSMLDTFKDCTTVIHTVEK